MKADRECLQLLNNSLYGFLKMDSHSREYAASLLSGFLFRLLLLGRQSASGDAQIEQAIRHIEENIGSALTLEELPSLCGISLSGFKHRFKECTGKTPRDYINNRKIEKAKDFLRAGKTVTETAMELGFSSSEYFAVVFKKYTTLQPGRYRKDT
jgi:AraC-like DNA-binding protein